MVNTFVGIISLQFYLLVVAKQVRRIVLDDVQQLLVSDVLGVLHGEAESEGSVAVSPDAERIDQVGEVVLVAGDLRGGSEFIATVQL